MVQHKVRWNHLTKEWFCLCCGRTSDHMMEQDARGELEQYECSLPCPDIKPADISDNC
jgi:hypothetical protein